MVMGGFEKFLSFPILEWKNDFMGFTDYIDRIQLSDVSDPVMIGTDCYNRSFITLKLKKNLEKEFVIIMFQRYTNHLETWTHGKRGYSTIIDDAGYFMNNGRWRNEKLKEVLFDLCSNKMIAIQQHDNENFYSLAD